jgi:hypothetical protein
MGNEPDSPPDRKPTAAETRQAERAAALRANLMRRKAQARTRKGTQGEEGPKTPAEP